MPATTRRAKRGLKPVPNPPALKHLQIVAHYTSDGDVLSEEEKKKLIRNIKKEHYYHTYLSGHFKFAFEDLDGLTEAKYTWKGAAGANASTFGESYDRVLALLVGNRYDVLPEGVKGKVVEVYDV